MQRLRNAALLARLVLAWFALSLGVAMASPLVKPQSLELVCGGGGAMKLLSQDGQGKPAGPHTLDCPLCASWDSPPAAAAAAGVPAKASLAQPSGGAETFAAKPTAGPPPARGPPAQQAPI